ncbi:MAG: transposase [Deltaproteobacteria bacterium]|nr:transposase [Deltaproteobacteria bacterium]
MDLKPQQAGREPRGDNHVVVMGRRRGYHKSREIEGKVKTVTAKRDSVGDFWPRRATDWEFKPVGARAGKNVGLDFGLKDFLARSDGSGIESSLFFRRAASEIRTKGGKLSSKSKGSLDREKARLDLARTRGKVGRRRKDFHFKTALGLARDFAEIRVEDPRLKDARRLWGRKIPTWVSRRSRGSFGWERLKNGAGLVKIPRFFPSSKTRSARGHVQGELDLKTRRWTWIKRGVNHDCDARATRNIQRVEASARGGEGVRPVSTGVLR